MRDRIVYLLERYIQRGAGFQLLAIAGLIVLVALLGGLTAYAFSDAFGDPFSAVWWSFLRLTDPGYLGDDEGALLRTVSLIVTVLGYVLFMGSLIAIMTQWLQRFMRRLESGLTPISMRGHLLILGWTNRTPAIIRELTQAERRVRRFLQLRGVRTLRIVILADEVDARMRYELRARLGDVPLRHELVFRSGSSLRTDALHRVAFRQAGAVILPGADFALGGAEPTDARIIKTLMSMAQQAGSAALPPAVAEIFDGDKLGIAEQAYEGTLDVVSSDAFISHLIAQNVRHPGLSHVYAELLSYAEGNDLFVRTHPQLAGVPWHRLTTAFPRAIVAGVVRPRGGGFEPHLAPPPGFVLADDDRVVLVARRYEDTEPADVHKQPPAAPAAPPPPVPRGRTQRLLVLGWSHKARALVRTFASRAGDPFEIDFLSLVPSAERAETVPEGDDGACRVRHLDGDYTRRDDLLAVAPEHYDRVILLASDWLATGDESDARTVLGYVLLRSLLADRPAAPGIVIELMDPQNAPLFAERPGEVIISPLVLSRMLAHIALRRELSVVFQELFGPYGTDLLFRPASDYGLTGRPIGFAEIQRAVAPRGDVALGLRRADDPEAPPGGIRLNPSRRLSWTLRASDEIVVLRRDGETRSQTHGP